MFYRFIVFSAIAVLPCGTALAVVPSHGPNGPSVPAVIRAFRHTELLVQRITAALSVPSVSAQLPAPPPLPSVTLPLGPPMGSSPFAFPTAPITTGPFGVLPPQTFGGGGGTVAPPTGGSFGAPPPLGGSFGGGRPTGGSFGNGRP